MGISSRYLDEEAVLGAMGDYTDVLRELWSSLVEHRSFVSYNEKLILNSSGIN